MKMEIHEHIEKWLTASITEALSPDERNIFEQHLAGCERCRTMHEQEKNMNQIISDTFSELKPDEYFEERMARKFRRAVASRSGFFSTLARLVQARPLQWAVTVLALIALVKSGMILTGENFRSPVLGLDLLNAPRVTTKSGQSSTIEIVREFKFPHNALTKVPMLGDIPAVSTKDQPVFASRAGGTKSFEGFINYGSPIKRSGDHESDRTTGDAINGVGYNYDLAKKEQSSSAGDPSDLPVTPPVPVAAAPAARKLIRNANVEFEISNFETAADTITGIAIEEEGYVATRNSARGANGKLRGTIVVKMLPANLDRFLLKIRALGELKSQTLGADDVTKAYFDTDARLRNSKLMEERLLDMLQKNTGKVADLLQVEKELGRVRQQIEEMQGELKYWDSMVAYATVTISLGEKDMNQPAAFLLKEHANLALFSPDVEKTFVEAKREAEAAKAQIVVSQVNRDDNGRITATLRLLIAPEVSEATVSKMKTLGRVQNFDAQSERVARDGSGNSDAAKIERDKTELNLTIQRDEATAAQQTALSVLTDHVEEKTAQIKQSSASAGVEVKSSAFNRAANGAEIFDLTFRMPMQKYAAFIEQIKSLGKVKNFTVSRRDDAQTGADATAEITLQIFSQGDIVADDTGVFSTVRKTLGQGFASLMWSMRMIGVSLAFIAPWALALGAVVWIIVRRRRSAKK